MDPLTALSAIAAIAVTLTGFAGLLAAFRSTDVWQPVELFAVRYLVLTSASACVLALLPIPMSIGGYPELWPACLLILAGWLLFVILWTVAETFRSRTRPRRLIRYVITQTAGLLLVVWAAVTAFGLVGADKAAVYVWGLLWFVATSISQLTIEITHGIGGGGPDKEF
jgi:hypothetical protein